jgi:hypothetical protein
MHVNFMKGTQAHSSEHVTYRPNDATSSISAKELHKLVQVVSAFMHGEILTPSQIVHPGSAITNRREPRSCLGRVFNSKLGCIATLGSKCMAACIRMQPLLKLKTRPKARPVS